MFLNFYKMQIKVTNMPSWIVAPRNLGTPFKRTPSGIMSANPHIMTIFMGVLQKLQKMGHTVVNCMQYLLKAKQRQMR